MGDDVAQDKTGELFKVFPFLQSFPFEGYSIIMSKEGSDPSEMGVAPILIEKLGNFGTEHRVGFNYTDGKATAVVSFYKEDVQLLLDNSHLVKKLNKIREDFDGALESKDLELKVEMIKTSRKFIKKVGLPHLLFQPFGGVLDEFIKVYETPLNEEVINGLKRLSVKKVVEQKISKNEEMVVHAFLNFRLHYAKIILGIIIAAKIH